MAAACLAARLMVVFAVVPLQAATASGDNRRTAAVRVEHLLRLHGSRADGGAGEATSDRAATAGRAASRSGPGGEGILSAKNRTAKGWTLLRGDRPNGLGSTLSDKAMKTTWPADWTRTWGEQALLESQHEANPWAEEVREAMRHTWRGYKQNAWGMDRISPDSGDSDNWCHMAVTMVDGLSTLYLMGLHDEFNEACDWIEQQHMPTPGSHGTHSLFEMNIRALGGLLSAYALSQRPGLLETARRLGDGFMPAFRTSSGLPMSMIDIGTGHAGWNGWAGGAILAEVATVQMEMRYLSHATGNEKYAEAADRAEKAVLSAAAGKGLVPVFLSTDGNTPSFIGGKINMGAMGDSYYEYLIKQWLQSGRKEDHLKNAWKASMLEMKEELVERSAGGRTFIAQKEYSYKIRKMDHLACFVPGMLMLGSQSLPAKEVDPDWKLLAGELTDTCYSMYKESPSGLAPEYVDYDVSENALADMSIPDNAPHNLLRPETAEAIYYMWYHTGDPKYRHMAHEIFSAFQKHCKSLYGYSAVADVREETPRHKNKQESFWLAETLKYLYLTFMPRSTLDLDRWVLNTEAQPLPRWQ